MKTLYANAAKFIFGIAFVFCSVALLGAQNQDHREMIESGKEHYKAGQLEEAVKLFTDVINKSVVTDHLFSAYIYLAYVHFIANNPDKIAENLEKAIILNPEGVLRREEFTSEFSKRYDDAKDGLIGFVYFTSNPSGATIHLDGKKLGVAPIKKDILKGNHFARAFVWGHSAKESVFEIQPKTLHEVHFDLTLGRNWKTFAKSSVVMVVLAIVLSRI